jgi:hypothetical protein
LSTRGQPEGGGGIGGGGVAGAGVGAAAMPGAMAGGASVGGGGGGGAGPLALHSVIPSVLKRADLEYSIMDAFTLVMLRRSTATKILFTYSFSGNCAASV